MTDIVQDWERPKTEKRNQITWVKRTVNLKNSSLRYDYDGFIKNNIHIWTIIKRNKNEWSLFLNVPVFCEIMYYASLQTAKHAAERFLKDLQKIFK